MLKRILINISLVLASLLFSAVVIELALRFVYPVYESAARVQYDRDDLRIWAPRANRRSLMPHPDTGVEHLVITNNLALRQSRDFSDLAAAANIGFFGDSYTVNNRLPAPYSFTEPLDYLLNQGGMPFNVLNFGVNGYGTDQSYLAYKAFAQRKQLAKVFYLLCANDLRNVYESNLFSLDPQGELVGNAVPERHWWVRPLSRLHITYLFLDLRQRFLYAQRDNAEEYRKALERRAMVEAHRERTHTERAEQLEESLLRGQDNDDLARTVLVFQRILEQWQREVQADGGEFYVVLLPTGREEIFTPLLQDRFRVISLLELLRRADPAFEMKNVAFKNDSHWAEEGNRLAALYLYEALAADLELPERSHEELEGSLAVYYAAFPGGWQPASAANPVAASPGELATIRQKYIPLELDH